MTATTLAAQLTRLTNQISTIIVGKSTQIEDCVACLLAGGHLLIEDVPGVGMLRVAGLRDLPGRIRWAHGAEAGGSR